MGNSESIAGPARPPPPGGSPPNPYGAAPGSPYGPSPHAPPRYMTPEQLHVMMHQQGFYGPSPYGGGFVPPPAPPCRMEQATAIRNDVNLKKGTMRFVESDEAPGRLFLEFDFDANAPCAITVRQPATLRFSFIWSQRTYFPRPRRCATASSNALSLAPC